MHSRNSSPKSDHNATFSDDDSLLLQCTQEVEDRLFATAKTSPVNIQADNNCNSSVVDGFESDESFEMFMSQIDESEVVSKKESNKENNVVKTFNEKAVNRKNVPVELQDDRVLRQPAHSSIIYPQPSFKAEFHNQASGRSDPSQVTSKLKSATLTDSPTSSRPIKKFRSSDDGLKGRNMVAASGKDGGGGTPLRLRRIQSDNNVTASSNAVELRPSCTQQEIERKKMEAKMKRQLRSQMKP